MRRAATLIVLCTLIAVVVVSVVIGSGLTVVDPHVLDFMLSHRTPGLTVFFRAASQLGGTVAATVVIAVVMVLAALRRWWLLILRAFVAGVGASALVVGLKVLVNRQRPPVATRLSVLESLSFPSGHALGSLVAGYMVLVLAFAVTSSRLRRTLAVLLVAAYVVVVGLSRLYLGVHWASDVLGGWLIGAAWATLVCWPLRRGSAQGQLSPR